MSNLVIVESPAKATTIKKYLGKNYEVISSKGHVRDLPKSRIGIDIENDFEPEYINIRGKGELIRELKKYAKKASKVYLATDPDREGEAISWHLANILGIDISKKSRVTFNEITKSAVKEGIKNARTIDMDLVDAQQARRSLDRVVGYKLSPFLWKKVKKGLSAGRVQSVATRLIAIREREIEDFVPKEYWDLKAEFDNGEGKLFTAKYYGFQGKKYEITSKTESDKILSDLEGAKYIISKLTEGIKNIKPQPPFITSTLQQDALRKLNFQSRKTMQIAQELYEGINIKGYGTVGLITYMRTDSLRISDIAKEQAKEYIINKYSEKYYPSTPRIYKNKSAAQDAHEAIRPTSVDFEPETIKENLSKDQYKLYKLIYSRFIASQMADQVQNTISAEIIANNHAFRASGYTVKFDGYTKVYEVAKEKTDENSKKSKKLPRLIEGNSVVLNDISSEQKFTQPPSRYTEATLIKTLEENGIGRPSTYAPTITTIIARRYVQRQGKTLVPTHLGMVTTKLMEDYFSNIVDVEFTAAMEKELDDVEQGKMKWKDVLRNFYPEFEATLKKAEEEIGDLSMKIPDVVSDEKCELCGRNLVVKLGRFGEFLACPGYPECKFTKQIIIETKGECPECGGKILVRKSKTGKIFYSCENYPKCNFMTWDEPTEEKCPKCNKSLAKKSRSKGKIVCLNSECDYEK